MGAHGGRPEHAALLTPSRQWTYLELDHWTDQIAHNADEIGIKKGDRVLLWAEPSPRTIATFFGLMRAGCIVAPLSTRLAADQILPMARKIGAHHLFADTHFADRAPQGEALQIHNIPQSPVPSELSPLKSAFHEIDLEQDATIIFTSGSTREPKAALHTFGCHYYNALGSNQNIHIEQGDRWLLSLPIFHVAGIALMMRAFLAGATVALPDPQMTLEQAIFTLQPTHLSLVPTQLLRLLDHSEAMQQQLQSCRAILLGGSAIPVTLLERAAAQKLPIFTSYGSTEMASQITTTRPQDGLDAWRTAGQLLPFREIKLAPDQEIWVRGQTRFRGYLSAQGLEMPFDQDGWFPMGDLGRWDEQGRLHILGRKDAMFISGGENIQPEEIEWHLTQHPLVESVLVVDIPDITYVARPVAFLKFKQGQPPQPQELRDFLQQRLPRFKIPDHFLPWPDLPPQQGIKPSRGALKRYAQQHLPTQAH